MPAVLDLATDTDQAVDLEALLDAEPHCEATHHRLGGINLTCSETATGVLVRECRVPRRGLLICETLVIGVVQRKLNPHATCAHCKRTLAECWNVVPL